MVLAVLAILQITFDAAFEFVIRTLGFRRKLVTTFAVVRRWNLTSGAVLTITTSSLFVLTSFAHSHDVKTCARS